MRPRARVAALTFDATRHAAPRLVAKGDGLVAERILAIAREHGIPIREDRALVDVLARLDVNAEVPPELYVLVAEIIAWVYRLQPAEGWRRRTCAARRAGGIIRHVTHVLHAPPVIPRAAPAIVAIMTRHEHCNWPSSPSHPGHRRRGR